MTPAARLQAAIEILDEVIASARDDGPPADVIVTRYFKTRRYAGSGDRRAVRELVFRAIRRSAERPDSGRAAIVGLARDDPQLPPLFGQVRGPAAIAEGEEGSPAAAVPSWLEPEISPLIDRSEWPALLERAPLDLRVNVARADRDALIGQFPGAQPTRVSPWGLRLPPDSRVDQHPAYADGLVEVQDEGSQLVALACEPREGERILDLCAGGGGKALALAAAAAGAQILATDTNRSRLSKLPPRAAKAGARIESRLLDMPRELEGLADWADSADLVLVDAPCSGSGTWRRNPEGRWRLSPERLERMVQLQSRLLDIGAAMVRPGGRLVYAVCSILTREGEAQAADFLSRRSSWVAQETAIHAGRLTGVGRLLVPGQDGTDGFFVARLARPC
ncbi:RsmB/NOP family class I SAM-dependent RNA methyltransferase [Sphingomonas sp.]|uniref:RsmB/NOP family class I SAM-dependent RNA methyltransferase n=1 Tax=Sphingomonas sp. TaxID=28214 RepID=UPI0017F594A7|nr:RsmB/NOP family class I SAM-dependent RNA methyltransferase [Sphingomonas sp.]MBA3511304.1 RsmB/NOP family class I SAM-dependent RNA methyltransferase [Sphingomonas sp.]